MLPWKLRKRQFLPVHQNLSSVHFSLAKFQLVSSNLSLAMIWQMTHNHKLPKLCSATLSNAGVLSLKLAVFARRYFFFIFQLFQFDQITVETLYNGHLRDIEESGHSREVERRVNVCHVWTVRRKKKTKTKMARVER